MNKETTEQPRTMDKPELETLDYRPEQPKEEVCHKTMTGRECDDCSIDDEGKCPIQPNTNAMIFEQINGCQNMTIDLLGQLKPRTEQVESCVITLKSWRDNNLKHLQKAFE